MSLSGKARLTTERVLANNNFWPDVSLGELTENYRVPVDYADEVISTALKMAILYVNRHLSVAKEELEKQGFTSVELYATANTNAIDDEEEVVLLYRHAVCCQAKAFLLEQAKSLHRLPNATAKEVLLSDDFWLQQAQGGIELLNASILKTSPRDLSHLTVMLL